MNWIGGGLAEWTEGDTAYLSVAFSWKLPEAYQRCQNAGAQFRDRRARQGYKGSRKDERWS